ncbi:MAG: MBL fold metallo-hydrolase [Myxococcaceae bacterium]
MSEPLAGVPRPPPTPGRIREASAVILYRRNDAGELEVFWLRREKKLTFAGGFYAFPGGRLDASDAEVKVEGAEGRDAALVVAAARELLEETGVLVASGAERLTQADVDEMRRGLLEKKVPFKVMLDERELTLHRQDFRDAGRWITPPFLPVRYDTWFYLVEAPRHAKAEVWPGELAYGAWVRPSDALREWAEGKSLLHPPNSNAMRVMERFTGSERDLEALQNPPHCPNHVAQRIDFQQGILLVPLETDTLPPATHTNAYVLGNGELLIVDPGSGEPAEYGRLVDLIEALVAEGRTPKAVFLTHHHADHVGGALAVKERLGVPLWAHARTADRMPAGAVDRLVADGDVIELAGSGPGSPAMRWRVLHTPGHARGHLCLVDEATRAAVVGDMVAGIGSIVIDPPEGDMGDYLEQLQRLHDLPVTTLYPAHGPAIPDGPGKLVEYLAHRRAREQRVLEAIPGEGGATLTEIVAKAYSDTPDFMHPVAERSAQAILDKLVREARVSHRTGRYFVASV